ncbi:efflux transporter outer membrane subunit [Caballeronia sp. LZ035]|uniref:efflux transporter outer membrane subunit n=1 Tax=Caballeronia sp. LZ035 TaxID=3038568 RepID=UPI002865E157|nr:efflux transporter outer membrane subunit [Caballeronia sp. LZ035]MDR5760647.1 efflux transporter outer membrane subunit [Caballeronia sp. LZ035]
MMKRLALTLPISLALSACLSQSPPPAANVASPAAYRYAGGSADSRADTLSTDWWRSFGNDELDRLIAQAGTGNYDVAAALARVKQARASARIAGAGRYPQISGFADASRQGGFVANDTIPTGSAYDFGIEATFELDLWGRNRAISDAASARLSASAFDRASVELTMSADVANAWLQTVGLRERGDIARRNRDNASRILRNIESQYRAGFVTALDVTQQRTLVAAQQRVLASLSQQANDSEAALALLLGVPASGFAVATRSLNTVNAPTIGAGLPSTLLTRRPDVAAAEARLAAAHADVAAARAAMLPGITLGASVGTGGDRLQRIFDNPLYTLSSALAAPVFNAGALAAGRDLALAQREELLAAYRQSIVAAFADVERALNASAGSDAQILAQRDELSAARRTLELAQSRYRAGAETSLTVLDAQRTLYDAEDSGAQVRLARLQAAVSTYRALGGGWHDGTPDKISHQSQR